MNNIKDWLTEIQTEHPLLTNFVIKCKLTLKEISESLFSLVIEIKIL